MRPPAETMAPTSTSDTMGVVSASMTTVTTATAPVVAEPIPTPYKELESTVQSTPPMAEQVPEEETGTDSAIGEGVDTQDITVNDVPESAEGMRVRRHSHRQTPRNWSTQSPRNSMSLRPQIAR